MDLRKLYLRGDTVSHELSDEQCEAIRQTVRVPVGMDEDYNRALIRAGYRAAPRAQAVVRETTEDTVSRELSDERPQRFEEWAAAEGWRNFSHFDYEPFAYCDETLEAAYRGFRAGCRAAPPAQAVVRAHSPKLVAVWVTEIVAALERECMNTDTDPRWLAASELRRMDNWEARTLMCEIATRCKPGAPSAPDVADDPSDPSSPIQHLTSLLANIHRDNGQYTWSHGNRQSVLRAYEILDEMRTQAESHRWMTQAKAREDSFFKNAPSPPGAPPRADREPTAAYWRHTILCPAVGNQGACNCQLEEHMRTRIIELEAELSMAQGKAADFDRINTLRQEALSRAYLAEKRITDVVALIDKCASSQAASHRWMTQATKDFDRAETERAKFEQVMWDEHEKVAALMARAEYAERQLEKFVQDENEELDEAIEKIAALDKRITDVVALIDKCASSQAPDSAYRDGVLVALGEIRAALQPNKEKDDA